MQSVGRKRTFYFPAWMTRELDAEAIRLDRSVSWILQRAWKVARMELRQIQPRSTGGPQAGGSQGGNGAPA
jgi:uncharacterized small protein (TIGR04563 family)